MTRHILVVGATGSGKSTTLRRLIYGWCRTPSERRPVTLVIDPKPDPDDNDAWTYALAPPGSGVAVRFPERPYDMWRGDGRQVAERLLTVVEVTEPYYRDALSLILRLACGAPNTGPPRGWDELLERMSASWMRRAYAHDPRTLTVIRQLDDRALSGATSRIATLRATVGHLLRQAPDAWAWEDVDGAYVAVDATTAGAEARTVAAILLADLVWAFRVRTTERREVLVCVDEAPQVVPAVEGALAQLVETLRSAGVGIVLATQSRAGLGPDVDRILSALGGPVVLHRVEEEAEEWAQRSGTTREWEARSHLLDGGIGAEGMTVPGDAWTVHPQRLRSLPDGHVMVIAAGRAVEIAVQPVTASHSRATRVHEYPALSPAPNTSSTPTVDPITWEENAP